ncbi:MAG: PQQ-dependent sugar dehydrogenase [Solirubrobacteraceae bacterium]|nr:PQQ-dependent sugar dehydrogenase [Solirubrobacteraceae bacterium]
MAAAVLAGCAGTAHGLARVNVVPATSAAHETPIHVTAPANDPRVFVVQRGGAVHIVRDGVRDPDPYLVVPEVDTQANSERGLLSIAFAPDYARSGLVYAFAVVLTSGPSEIRILEYRAEPGADTARLVRTLISAPVGATNHNGGQLVFGPDGKLYATIGDNAVPARAQDLASLFGKVLRLDPRGPSLIPADNPFGNAVWALGLRNPYRASFTPQGQLIIADVGQGSAEELNIGAAGANFGWPTCEGPCAPANAAFTDPAHVYPNDNVTQTDPWRGCAVIGGITVRDPDLTGLTGRYLFGDLCAPPLRSIDPAAPAVATKHADLQFTANYSLFGFGEDGFGCVYILADRRVDRIAPSALSDKTCPRAVGQPIPGIPAVANPDPIRPSGPGAGLPPAVVTPTPPTGAGPVTPGPDVPAAAIPSRLTVVSTSLRIDARGRIAVKVRCTGTDRCSGRLRVTSAAKVRRPGSRRARTLTLAGATLTGLPAGTRTVRLTLRRADRALITGRVGKRLRVRVRVVTNRPGQASLPVSSRVLTLRAPA